MFKFLPSPNSPLLASNLFNRGVEGGIGQFPNKTAFDSFFGYNVVARLFGYIISEVLFSASYVWFAGVFLFGLYLPLLTQSSLFLFSLYQTTVLPLPRAFLTYCLPCVVFSLKHVHCSFAQNRGYLQQTLQMESTSFSSLINSFLFKGNLH